MLLRGKIIATIILGAVFAVFPAWAKIVKDFESMPRGDRSEYVVNFLEKMTNDIGQTNPKLAQDIRDYFDNVPPGKQFPEGLENLYAELAAVNELAKQGKIDLSKIQIEGVIVKIVKEKFPPPQRQEAAK